MSLQFSYRRPSGSAVCSLISLLAKWLSVVCKRSTKEEASLRNLASCRVSQEGPIIMWQKKKKTCLSPVCFLYKPVW